MILKKSVGRQGELSLLMMSSYFLSESESDGGDVAIGDSESLTSEVLIRRRHCGRRWVVFTEFWMQYCSFQVNMVSVDIE